VSKITRINFHTEKFSKDKVFFNHYDRPDEIAVIIVRKEIIVDNQVVVVKAIHPFTRYIIDVHLGKSFKTQMNQLDSIVPFLNYSRNMLRQNGKSSIGELKLTDVTQYINYSINHLQWSEGTTKKVVRDLTNFLYYLSQHDYLPNIPKSSFRRVKKVKGVGTYVKSPIKGIMMKHTHDKPRRRINELPSQYLMLLLEVALNTKPRIALGIYLQLFGGLRTGSVVNTTRLQVKRRISSGDYRFAYSDKKVRTDIRDLASSGTKFNDEAMVDNINGLLDSLVDYHMSLFKPSDGSNALFVNARGKQMTSSNYADSFRSVRDAFIAALSEGDNEDRLNADYLRTVSFTPHSLRGIFSNLIADTTDNIAVLAYRRRDKNFESSLPYLTRTNKMRDELTKRMEEMHLSNLDRYKLIEKGDDGK
jgi:hypothetical protein